jgi:hypothetical protein
MREIKFRGWDIDNKKMYYNVCFMANWGFIKFGFHGTPWTDSSKAGIGMQYTGYKDKNEKEIYEGDIVRYTSYYNGKTNIDLVQWKEIEDMEGYYHKNYSEWIVGYDTLIDIVKNIHTDIIQIEVIGNLYENFELLEKSIDNGDME